MINAVSKVARILVYLRSTVSSVYRKYTITSITTTYDVQGSGRRRALDSHGQWCLTRQATVEHISQRSSTREILRDITASTISFCDDLQLKNRWEYENLILTLLTNKVYFDFRTTDLALQNNLYMRTKIHGEIYYIKSTCLRLQVAEISQKGTLDLFQKRGNPNWNIRTFCHLL